MTSDREKKCVRLRQHPAEIKKKIVKRVNIRELQDYTKETITSTRTR